MIEGGFESIHVAWTLLFSVPCLLLRFPKAGYDTSFLTVPDTCDCAQPSAGYFRLRP